MGQFLHLGIGLVYSYEEELENKFSKETIEGFLEQSFDKQYYNSSKSDGMTSYVLKQSILENNLVSFLEEIFSRYPDEDPTRKTLIQKLTGRTYGHYLILSRNKYHHNFQENTFCDLYKEGFNKFHLYGEMISIFSIGKINFECYGYLLKYLENLHKELPIDNPLKNTIRIKIN
ncbi:hypothetical protein KY334_05600 [Candidatus Woesearchaeota archaeon]|nr:hypothetical protein [Candidatus Woesearchaeota archaeon]